MTRDEDRLRLRHTFDEAAGSYHQVRPDYPAGLFDELIDVAGLAPGDHLLELGCGPGKATVPLARRGFRITCVELGPELAAAARSNLAGLDAEVVEGRFEEWQPRPGELREQGAEIEASGRFEVTAIRHFDWERVYDAESYVALLRTFSGHIAMEQWQRDRLYGEIRHRLARRPGQAVRRHWGAVLHVAPPRIAQRMTKAPAGPVREYAVPGSGSRVRFWIKVFRRPPQNSCQGRKPGQAAASAPARPNPSPGATVAAWTVG